MEHSEGEKGTLEIINSKRKKIHHFQNLRVLTVDDEEIMEIVAMSGMGVFYTHLANATKINIDEGFIKKISGK